MRKTIAASSGRQLNGVDLAMVNITTDFSIDRPSLRGTADALSGNTSTGFYGMIFILQVQRVTRLYYALQVGVAFLSPSASGPVFCIGDRCVQDTRVVSSRHCKDFT